MYSSFYATIFTIFAIFGQKSFADDCKNTHFFISN
jgi:hypothetical protein